jgi:hypothetical protein
MKRTIVSRAPISLVLFLAVCSVEAQQPGGNTCLIPAPGGNPESYLGPDACYQEKCKNGFLYIYDVKANGASCTGGTGQPTDPKGTCYVTGTPNEENFVAFCNVPVPPSCSAGCVPAAGVMTSEEAVMVENGVLSLAEIAAEEVTREGPTAWNKFFAKTPKFFMAADGRITYADGASAQAGNVVLARTIKQITLRWGRDIRVDPLTPEFATMAATYHEARIDTEGRKVEEDGFFTGTAEYSHSRWQFRNAHWSTLATH